jgi:hypothetical protein
MTRINWGTVGERFYEIGLDRGVLYVDEAAGVPWVGLIAVSESPSGGDPSPYYIDGAKYLNLSTTEEFEATLTAYTRPPEFYPCEGEKSIHNGLYVCQQPRKPFGMCYRTKVGNDIAGSDHAYKIHVVYNALVAPAQKSNNTMSASVDPTKFSWNITTVAPAITGFKRTAHLVIDSRYVDPDALLDAEDILYGDESTSARLPDPNELISLLEP